MASTVTFTTEYTLLTCGDCGINFGVPEWWRKERLSDHRNWNCPNGHIRHYPSGQSDVEKANARVAEAERLAAQARLRERAAKDQLAASERSKAALRGQTTKLKRRAARGICIVCNRSFPNVTAHMETKHPDFIEEVTGERPHPHE